MRRNFNLGKSGFYVKRKCHGIIGVLSRAAPVLPKDLLRLAYVALIRSHLEYSSIVIGSAAKTNLGKLDTVQKIA